jgi:2-succinyl-6-hydroxy-2,4-cyclohexadiene-1-carboxylate synthase
VEVPEPSDFGSAAHAIGDAGGPGIYVGYSMGGRLCLHAALAHPEAVERLVVIGGTAGIDHPTGRRQRVRSDEALARRIEHDGMEAFVKEWLANPLFAGLPPESRFEAERLRNQPHGIADSLRRCGTGTQQPLWTRLGSLGMPVLAIAGREDAKYASIATRIADLEAVLDFLAKLPELDGRFGLVGSSLGGFVALWVAAARRPPLPVVTWNAPANLREIGGSNPQAIEAYGSALVDEVRAGRHVEAPSGASHVLVVQGASDEVVPPAHGRAIHGRCAAPSAIHVLDGADHRLSDPSHRARAIDLSRLWLAEHLATTHMTGEAR